nr:membrane protein [uncultured bacterium]
MRSSRSSRLSFRIGPTTVLMPSATRSGDEKSSSASSRCRPSRRAAYQIQRRNVALALPSSAGELSGIFVRYSMPPIGTVLGARSGSRWGRSDAARVSIWQTRSGGSSWAKVTSTSQVC